MSDTDLFEAKVRGDGLSYAMQTSERGEDPMAVLARAQLYADFVLNGSALTRQRPADGSEMMVKGH
jgi:hypothetical protein